MAEPQFTEAALALICEDVSRAGLLFARTLIVVGSSELVVLTFCLAPANFYRRTLHCLILNRSRSAVSVNYHALHASVKRNSTEL